MKRVVKRDDKICNVVLDEKGYNIRLVKYSGFLVTVTWTGKIRVSGSQTFEFDSGSWQVINNEIAKGQTEMSKWILIGGGLEGFKSSTVVTGQTNIKPSQLEFGGIYQRANSSTVVIWLGEGELYEYFNGQNSLKNRSKCNFIFAETLGDSEIRGLECNGNQVNIACENLFFDTRSTKPNNFVKKIGQIQVSDLSAEIDINVARPSDNYMSCYRIITKLCRDSINKSLKQFGF